MDGDQSAFTWRMVNGQLFWLEFQASPNRLVVQSMDPDNGSVTGEKELTLDVSGDFYSPPIILAWQDPILWVMEDSEILGIDIFASSVKNGYP